ncbi:MAG: hypothetical protein RLZZ397_1112, partial [Pseudomonadota bacterium]
MHTSNSWLGDVDIWLLAEGSHLRPYECLGAHPITWQGVAGTHFAVWAPNAAQVAVVGNFNHWNGRSHPMHLRHSCGIWELFVPAVAVGELYKFEITTQAGERLLKSDPYAFAAQLRPDTASVVAGLPAKRPVLPKRQAANAFGQP